MLRAVLSTAEDDAEQPAAEPAKRKGKKKKGKAADTEDIDALLAEIGDAPAQHDAATADTTAAANGEAADLTNEAAAPSPEGPKRKGKKKKGKAAADTEDIDALLAELDGPRDQQPSADTAAADEAAAETPASPQRESAPAAAEPAVAADAGKGKKKKKKGKGGAGKEEEDLDAVLAELGMAPAAKRDAEPASDAQGPAEAAAADDAAGDDDDAADAGGNDKVLSCSAFVSSQCM